MTERDEQALRDALQGLGSDEPVDLGMVRRRAAERRRSARTVAGLAVVLVLVAGVVGLPELLSASTEQPTRMTGGGQAGSTSGTEADAGDQAQPEAVPPGREVGPSTEPAPDGWRTEYYRDVSFRVPSSWGYAVPPQSDWCAGADEPRADQRRPYVWLGISNIPVAAIRCPPLPNSMLTEHVEALSPGPAVDYVEGTVQRGDWWVVTRFAGSAVLVVTTQDRARAERILDSAQVEPQGAPCPPSSPVAGGIGTRPEGGSDLSTLSPVDEVVLCQYEPVEDPADVELPRLRAAVLLDRAAGQNLIDTLAAAPVNDKSCDPAPADQLPDLAVLVRLWADGQAYGVYVNARGCSASDGMAGGIDDGTTVRVLTRSACQQLLRPPLVILSGVGDIGHNCMG